MSEELKRRLVGLVVLLAIFSLIAWWVGSRRDQTQDLPSASAQVRNYDVRDLERIADAQKEEQAIAEPAGTAEAEPLEINAATQTENEPAEVDRQEGLPQKIEKPVVEVAKKEPAPEAARQTVAPAPKTEAPVAQKTEKPATDPKGGWVVQVSSVTQKDAATGFSQKLQTRGWKSFVEEGVVNGTTYYRVRVGPYSSREIADGAASQLQKELDQKVAVMSR